MRSGRETVRKNGIEGRPTIPVKAGRRWIAMSGVKRAVVVCAAAVLGLTLTPASAQAATASCYVGVGSSSCSSGSIPADAAEHYIYFSVRGGLTCARADFRIIDSGNGAVVYSRHVGAGVASGYVRGLYGSYYLRVINSCGGGGGKIEN